MPRSRFAHRVTFMLQFALVVASGPLLSAEPLPLEKKTHAHDGKTLPYRLLCPATVDPAKKYPLVIFLHGAGERGTDNEKQLVHGVPQFCTAETRDKYPCYLIAPQCPDKFRWVEVDWSAASHIMPKEPSEPAMLTLELIAASLKDLPIDANRVYVTGLSMGGYGTWDLLARKPELFAAGVPVCGGADEATAEAVKGVPVWAFHGAKDGVVKPARSKNMVAALEKAGAKPKFTEYPTVGHDAWNPAYKDPAMFAWLFAQKKQ